MRVCLFEDRRVLDLEPLTLTRPAFDLLCGQNTLATKQWRYFAPCTTGVLIRPSFVPLVQLERTRVAVNNTQWLRAAPTVLVNSRWLPPPGKVSELSSPCVALVGDEVAYAVVGPDRLTYCSPDTIDDCLDLWKATLPQRVAGGTLVRYLWDLVDQNGEQIIVDHEQHKGSRAEVPEQLTVVGPRDLVVVDPTARIEPLVLADTTNGPVVIDQQAQVTAFTRLEGPCYIGPGSQVLGAKIRAGTSLGPHCRVGGEVEASVILGHSNKYHEGFLGHAYLGTWVNLGAGTHNSDLRNDYGEVTVILSGRKVPTGQTKVGCFLGDHTKAGLGTLLNTGTNVGAFCNLLPAGGLLPKYVPSFASVWNGVLRDNVPLETLLETARVVMKRRGQVLTEIHQDLYRGVFAQTRGDRQWAYLEAERSRLRRSA